jgi:formylglycine-generating enzyme required for sulfatase activity
MLKKLLPLFASVALLFNTSCNKSLEFKLGEDRKSPKVEFVEISGTRLTPSFYMQKTETTVAQWECFLRETEYNRMPRSPVNNVEKFPNHPARLANDHLMVDYCKWLSKKIGEEVRLPTLAEYEVAAFGTEVEVKDRERYSKQISTKNNNIQGDTRTRWTNLAEEPGTKPVGSYPSNINGLKDIFGNVWETGYDNSRRYTILFGKSFARKANESYVICLDRGDDASIYEIGFRTMIEKHSKK